MLYKYDLNMVTLLHSIKVHLEDHDYDFPMAITGYPGTGKSIFFLDLIETWYRVILKKPVTKEMINRVNKDLKSWVKQFKELEPGDMNGYDESSRDLSSRDHNTKRARGLIKLYDVFRNKRFLSVTILPNFFRLNKVIREERLRALIWVNKRGEYKIYSMKGLIYLNGLNENRKIKNMNVARPFHHFKFPDYKGILLEEYQKQKNQGVDEVYTEVIDDLEKSADSTVTLVDEFKSDVKKLQIDGLKTREIAEELDISKGTVQKCIQKNRLEERR